MVQIGLLVSNGPTSATEDPISIEVIQPNVIERELLNNAPQAVIGEACGGGVTLPPWTICIYGAVLAADPTAANGVTELDDIVVSIRVGNEVLTGTTFVHAGALTPTFGIDISSLAPIYLEPIELSAEVNGQLYTKQQILYPDFRTMSQKIDLYVDETAAFDPILVWGTVINYGELTVVEGATVTLQYGSPVQTVNQTTAPFGQDPTPVFRFTAAELPGYEPNEPLTLTVEIDGNQDRRVVTPDGVDPVQIDLVTGWACDEHDPLPRLPSARGFPRLPSARGFPDVGCISGVGLLNGVPAEGIRIEVEANGEIFEDMTGLADNEPLPSYSIAVNGIESLVGEPVTVTAIYNGLSQSWFTETLSLDDQNGLRVDLNILDAAALGNILSPNGITDIEVIGDDVWVGTTGGLLHYRLDPDPILIKWYTTANSPLLYDWVDQIQQDHLGQLWVLTDDYNSFQRFDPQTDNWLSVDPEENELEGSARVTETHQVWYLRGTNRNFRLDPATNLWEEIGLENRDIAEIVVDSQGVAWFADQNDGLRRYDSATDSWRLFDTSNSGISGNDLVGLAVDAEDAIWVATEENGVSRFQPSNDTWVTWSITATGSRDDRAFDIDVGPNGRVVLGAVGNLRQYDPDQDRWDPIDLSQSSYMTDFIDLMAFDEAGSLWIHHRNQGVARLGLDGEWTYLGVLDQGPISRDVQVIEEAADGTVWYGTTAGMSLFDPLTRQWRGFNTVNSGMSQNDVYAIGFTPDGLVLAGNTKGFDIYDRDTDSWTSIRSVELDGELEAISGVDAFQYDVTRGGMWIGSSSGLIFYDLNPAADPVWQRVVPPGFVNNFTPIQDIALGPDQSVWLATTGRGFYRFDPGSDRWDRFSTELNIPEIPSDRFSSIGVDSSGVVWAGIRERTSGSGLLRYRPDASNGSQFTLFDETNSDLGSDFIVGLEIDRFDRLWIATWDGLHALDTLDMTWSTYEVSERLGLDIFNNITFGRNNDLWISSQNGVAHWYLPLREADVALSGSGPERLVAGQDDSYMYRLEVVNQGDSAGEVLIDMTWPTTSTLQTISDDLEQMGGSSWSLGVLTPGSARAISLTLSGDLEAWVNTTHRLQAGLSAGSRETALGNNRLVIDTRIVEPDRSDVAVSISGPPLLVPNQTADFRLIAQNIGSLDAENSTIQLTLPEGLSFASATPAPTSLNPLVWSLGSLSSAVDASPVKIELQLTSDTLSNAGSALGLMATIDTTTAETITKNNSAQADLPVSTIDAETLILVAPERLAQQYGTSLVLDHLYQLAQHPKVNGLVIDVEAHQSVQSSYAAWDQSPADWRAANGVATAIKEVMSGYLSAYPDISAVVLVGGDSVLPFYRVSDRNPTMWHEQTYLAQLDAGTSVYYALAADMLLTDDFYGASDAIVPSSPFWPNQALYYLPELALGRLVETPAEMIATIDYFLDRDGQLAFDSNALIGGDFDLAQDYVDQQCAAFQAFGYATTCVTAESAFVDQIESGPPQTIWSAWHSSHYGMGTFADALDVDDIERYLLAGTVNGSMGCHAGLTVPDTGGSGSGQFSQDLVQAIAGKGGMSISSTAFTYGSFSEIGYTEQLYVDLLAELGATSRVGDALLAAKQGYFASRGWFDTLDEKTLLPVTLYGLPMSEIVLPEALLRTLRGDTPLLEASNRIQQVDHLIEFSAPAESYQRITTPDGDYFTYNDQVKAQHLLPLQPAHQAVIAAQDEGLGLKGFVLRAAQFREVSPFDPLIDESYALGASVTRNAEPDVSFSGWDRELPVEIGRGNEETGVLDFTLGLYDAEQKREWLLESASILLTYGDLNETRLPVIDAVTLFQSNLTDPFEVEIDVSDDTGVEDVILLFEQSGGGWDSRSLTSDSGLTWRGDMPADTTRYLIQVVDQDQNVSRTAWSNDFSSNPPLQSTATPLPTATPQPVVTPNPDLAGSEKTVYLPMVWGQ